jgi:hypothetical protein
VTSVQFIYWLQGFLELRAEKDDGLTPAQAKCVADHLKLVFIHEIDPSAGGKAEQVKLNNVHDWSGNPLGPRIRC